MDEKSDNVKDKEACNSKSLKKSSLRATHSEIEKRRRQKMNKHLNELVNHLPMNIKSKKPDKITILKMAVQHMKNLKGKFKQKKTLTKRKIH